MSFTWPNTTKLPLPNTDFGGKHESLVARTEMDSGTVRQRQRFTQGLQTVNVKWTLTADQWALFQGIHKWKLSNGADWFDISLPLGGSAALGTYTCRFVGDFSWEYVPFNEYNVTAVLETYTISPLTEAETDAALA